MACAVDASSPIRVTNLTGISNTNMDSASFTAPANSLLVVCIEHDGSTTVNGGVLTLTLSLTTGAALTWTQQVARLWGDTTIGGASYIYTAPAVTSEARVVRVNSAWTIGTGNGMDRSSKIYVVTGADLAGTPVDTTGAGNNGGSTTNNLTTTSITPGASGLLFAADCDWTAAGVFEASSDLTQSSATSAGNSSWCDGYKAVTSGVGATANLNAFGSGAVQHKWCQIIVREAPASAAVLADPWRKPGSSRPFPFTPGAAR